VAEVNILAKYLKNSAACDGAAPAVVTLESPPISYTELDRRARTLGHALLKDCGLNTGDRVAIAMSNHPAYFEILFGAWYAGLCVAPMNPRLHSREYAALMLDCDARLCFATPEIAEDLREYLPAGFSLLETQSTTYEALLAVDPLTEPTELTDDSPAWLFYTSGTTGRPKGATLTHRNLEAMVQSYVADSGAATDDTFLHLAPLSHAGGLLGLAYIYRGLGQLVPPADAMTPAVLRRCLNVAQRATFFVVPTLVRRMIDGALNDHATHEHVHKIIVGGAPLYAVDLRNAIEHFGEQRIWAVYGQGESPCTITHIPTELLSGVQRQDYDEILKSVGVARSGVEVCVLDDNDVPLAPGCIGEVAVRGDVVMAGYWNRPEASAEALRNDWLHTGDLGSFSENGLLTLVDRSKDLIISGGSNIYPREIEEVLLLHPAVVEVAVIGEQHDEWGEVPVAFIVAQYALDESELDELSLQHIARFKRPKKYIFTDLLPKSSYGKILKSELRTQLLTKS
jgi:long-chain acyl-CoA synthetase